MTGRVEELLGIRHPVLLGAFGGLSNVSLTAAVSESGGLGQYGLYGYSGDRIRETVAALRAATTRPFGLNLWIPRGDEVTPAGVDPAEVTAALAGFYAETGINAPRVPQAFLPAYEEQFAAVLEARPAVLGVVYGVPSADEIAAAHERGIRVLGTATTVAEARALAVGGVDAIVASGAEAAGHRVSFLRPAEESLVGTFALVPQIADAVEVPVIAAGGIADRRGVAASFALGAEGVVVGTAFLATRQSAATAAHRLAVATASADDTVLTRAMSGRLARGIPNRAVREIEASERIAPFPAQNWATGVFRAEAARRDEGELLSLWAGQAAPLARHTDAVELFAELVAGVPRQG
ncbi:MAG: 2-nitropropane dioxygenase [Leifsonia xyli]|nr:MAG: 2-nitropropane dioxygenase [Leifsonia xyli]